MKKKILATAIAATLAAPLTTHAGAKIKITDDSDINLGFRLQTLYLNNDQDFRSNNENEFRVRRARFRLGANVTQYFSMFLQTEFSNDAGGGGGDARLIDAFIIAKPHPLFHIYAGENMAPAARQNLTSSGGLMAMDRPGINNKVLTWGTKANAALNTGTIPGTDAGLGGDVDVRDLGVTLFGSTSLTEMTHVKYYLGVYEGAVDRVKDNERFTGRIQINFFDPEPGYYNLSTYLGKKKTLGIGGSYDTQNGVAEDSVTGDTVDYEWFSFDAFLDYPVGPGHLTAEVGYNNLNFTGGGNALTDGSATGTLGVRADQAEGNGIYFQSGYYMQGWQPWFEYEYWDANASGDRGSFDLFRIGLSYYFKGHNANVKVGYEVIDPEASGLDNIDTFGVGAYLTY